MTSPEYVEILAAPADQGPIARKLLAAAVVAGIDQDVVRTTSDGFRVPAAIAQAAGYGTSAADARAAGGSAVDNVSIPADVARADILAGHAPESLPAKLDGGPNTLTDQRADGPADAEDRPAEVRVAAETGAGVAPDPRRADAGDSGELTGQALDDALEAAGLPKTGKADEKRARLAAHRAGSAQ
jgi:hypothetical protein